VGSSPHRPSPSQRRPGEAGSSALEFRESIADALALYADELTLDDDAAPSIYDEWVALSLALGRGVLSRSGLQRQLDELSQRLAAGSPAEAWRALLELGRDLHLDGAGSSTFPLLQRHPASAGVSLRTIAWLSELGQRTREGDDAVVRELGGLHEIFLGLTLERLARPARRLRRSRLWLSPSDVLRWPANVRSKRLQRELGLSKHAVDAFGPILSSAKTPREVEQSLNDLFDPRVPPLPAGRCVLRASGGRRSSGSHYTPRALCLELVERVLAPLVAALPAPRSQALLSLRVCDPAMGAGAFLVAAAGYLADALIAAWRNEGVAPYASQRLERAAALRQVATTVLRGVDENSTAVSLARWSLALSIGEDSPPPELERHLRPGDALIGGLAPEQPELSKWASAEPRAFDWHGAFGDVFERINPGFDAIVGNPPWVAYVGRAAQPLPPARAAYYAATNPAFKRYRTLHGLFVYRSATLLRRGGRLGLVLPTSVADLAGYSATRAAHDELCRVDTELPDWGDGAFNGVFQPCMALLSTRRDAAALATSPGTWPLRNDTLGPVERQLLERLARLPRLPRELFGERGFQTTEDDQAHLRRAPGAIAPCTVALREGADIGEFRALPPQLFGDPERLGHRLRPPAAFREVKLLIRQTARYPLAALSDGRAFRNSILAGFETAEFPAPLLLGLLNSNLIRWLHFNGQRDARQGMPQLKVGHLRSLPAPPNGEARAQLGALGQKWGEANEGLDAAKRDTLDEVVSAAFGLSGAERELVAAWAALNPVPVSRRRPPTDRAIRPVEHLSARGF
jgi:hypothetical protein